MLQKGNAPPPQARAENMEMEEEEAVEVVDLATTKVPYPGIYYVRLSATFLIFISS